MHFSTTYLYFLFLVSILYNIPLFSTSRIHFSTHTSIFYFSYTLLYNIPLFSIFHIHFSTTYLYFLFLVSILYNIPLFSISRIHFSTHTSIFYLSIHFSTTYLYFLFLVYTSRQRAVFQSSVPWPLWWGPLRIFASRTSCPACSRSEPSPNIFCEPQTHNLQNKNHKTSSIN